MIEKNGKLFNVSFAALLLTSTLGCGQGFKSIAFDRLNLANQGAKLDGKAIYNTNCAGCHNTFPTTTKMGRGATQIVAAIQTIDSMKGLSFLTPDQLNAIAIALGGSPIINDIAQLETCDVAPDVGRVTIHRLNRVEYSNTVQDLFGISTDLKSLLPQDAVAGNFHNNADALSVTPFLIEKYLDAAEAAVNEAFTSQRSRIMICDPATAGAANCARTILQSFASKAYRRSLEGVELTELTNRYAAAAASPSSTGSTNAFENGMRVALQAVLVSPHFLFRMVELNNPDNPDEVKRLDGYELATRLSYFLWSSKPDDQLMSLASDNRLLQPAHLEAQIQRMLKSQKASALVDNFATDWLELHRLEMAMPETAKFPEFNQTLRSSMSQESRMLLSDIFANDLSIRNLLTAESTFVNRELAGFYGLSGVNTDTFQKISIADSHRRGILGHAGVLTITSNPDRTNIVKRGKWILDNLLCDTPPPPPANLVTDIDPHIEGTLRERLEAHRSKAACYSCHAVMDPLGFGMENFNGIGKWRTKDDNGATIDSKGTLPDGRTFSGALELTNILKADPKFSVCVSKKLMTYAMGRELKSYDQCTVNRIAKDSVHQDQPFSHLVRSVVESDPFQKQRGDGGKK